VVRSHSGSATYIARSAILPLISLNMYLPASHGTRDWRAILGRSYELVSYLGNVTRDSWDVTTAGNYSTQQRACSRGDACFNMF